MPDRLFIPSPCHNFGCVYSEVSGGLPYSQTAKPCHFNVGIDEHHLLKKAYAILFGSPEAFLQNEKWRCLLRNMFSKQLPSRSLRMKTFSQTRTLTLAQVGQRIPLLTTRVETLAADKHVIAKLPLVLFWIIKLTRLTAGVCMRVRFKSKVTRGFSFSPLRDSCSPLRGSLTALTCGEISRKTSGTRVQRNRGLHRLEFQACWGVFISNLYRVHTDFYTMPWKIQPIRMQESCCIFSNNLLLNEAEWDMKNSADQGGCYPHFASFVIYYWTDARQTGIYLFYIITKQISTHKAFVYFKILQHNAAFALSFPTLAKTKKEAIWRNLWSIQNEAISLVTMRSKELWLVSEKNHATVKPDVSVVSHGMKTYNKGRIRGGGGRTRANSVCFTKNVVKIGAFPNATPTGKIWKKFVIGPKRSKTP